MSGAQRAPGTPGARKTCRHGLPRQRGSRARAKISTPLGGCRDQHTPSSLLAKLRALARPGRFRVRQDAEGYPIIPGRYGQIEWFDEVEFAVYCSHPRLFGKLWAIPGVRRHQTGDHEMRAIFPPEALDQVAGVIRAKRWGGSGRGRVENLAGAPDKRVLQRSRNAPDPRGLPSGAGAG